MGDGGPQTKKMQRCLSNYYIFPRRAGRIFQHQITAVYREHGTLTKGIGLGEITIYITQVAVYQVQW